MTEEELQIVEKLKFWRSEKYISLHQACMLAINLEPYEKHAFEDERDPNAPPQYLKLYTVLEQLINREYFYTIKKMEDDASSEEIYPDNAYFWPKHCIFNDEGLQAVSQVAMKRWLEDMDIDCPYYSALKIDKDEQVIVPRRSSKHSTRMMEIMGDVIERYYGENYDPTVRDSIPKQKDLVEWVRGTYTISVRLAEAVDIIIRPEVAKNTQGKNKAT